MRMIVTCRGCKQTWAFDVTDAHRISRYSPRGPMIEGWEACAFRLAREKCPKCCDGKRHVATVHGKNSGKHVCDSRCMASRGPTCDCSCRGANHGSSYL